MNTDEYAKMFSLEDRYWWFVARRRLALGLLGRRLEIGGGQTQTPFTSQDKEDFVSTPNPSSSPVVTPAAPGALTRGDEEGSLSPVVLDLGCGTGVVLDELSSWAVPVGLDMSPLALGFCRKRGIGRLAIGDGTAMPFEAGVFDAMIGLDVFEHIEDDEAAFAEAYRVLRPGGRLVLSVPAFKFLWGPHDVALHHFRRYTRGQVRDRLREAGFEVERCSYSVFLLFPLVVLWRIGEKRKKGPAKASLVALPDWANRLLIGIQGFEAWLTRWFDLPWGSSVVAVARKPL